MTTLITCLLTGKGSWSEVNHLANNADWEKIILITNIFGKEKYTPNKPDKTTIIVIDDNARPDTITKQLLPAFAGLFGEVAVNITSGNGNVHMALISALLQSGAGIRFVIPTEKSFSEV